MYTRDKARIGQGKRLILHMHRASILHMKFFVTCRLLARFTFPTGDESINDDLSTIEEVSKLSLPYGQVVRTLNAEAILKTKHCLFTQGTVGNLKLMVQV